MTERTRYLILSILSAFLLIQSVTVMYCMTPTQIDPTDNDDTVTRTFGFYGHNIELDIRVGDIEGCPTGPFRMINTGLSAEKYIQDDPTVDRLCDLIRPYTEGMSDYRIAYWLLDMVQYGIAYCEDSDQFGCPEYGQFPCETLFNKKGDCEDSSFLLFSLYRNFGIDCVLISMPDHMSVGVNVDGASGHYVLKSLGSDTTRYYTAEPCSHYPIGKWQAEDIRLVFDHTPTFGLILWIIIAFGWSTIAFASISFRRKD